VTNTEPNLYNVFVVSPPINLVAGNTTIVNCTGEIEDINGWSDITKVNATVYDITQGHNPNPTTADNNYRYFNTSCNCTSISANNASCPCLFAVQYFANNGTWQCNMTIADSFGLSDSMNSSTFTINTVIGIGVPNEVDYGDMSVTETSAYIPGNITNFGNVPINISVRGWGGTESYSAAYNDTSMICETGNISIYYERYAINTSIAYENMTNLTNTSTGIPNFDLPTRTNDNNYDTDTNTTYWKIQIPLTIGGYCNGTVQFSATDTS